MPVVVVAVVADGVDESDAGTILAAEPEQPSFEEGPSDRGRRRPDSEPERPVRPEVERPASVAFVEDVSALRPCTVDGVDTFVGFACVTFASHQTVASSSSVAVVLLELLELQVLEQQAPPPFGAFQLVLQVLLELLELQELRLPDTQVVEGVD